MGKGGHSFLQDTLSKELEPFAIYSVEGKEYRIKAGYFSGILRRASELILSMSFHSLQKALFTILGILDYLGRNSFFPFSHDRLIQNISCSHKNPSPESLVEQMEFKPAKEENTKTNLKTPDMRTVILLVFLTSL